MVVVFPRSRLVPKIGAEEVALFYSPREGRLPEKMKISGDGTGEGESRTTIRPLGLVIKEGTLCLVLWTPSPLIRCEGGDGQPGGAMTSSRRVTSSTHRGFALS